METLDYFELTKNTIEEGQSFWIGNKNAFEEFQSYFLKTNDKQSLLDRTVYSFREMIRNSKIDTIGDFVIGTYYNQKKSFICL